LSTSATVGRPATNPPLELDVTLSGGYDSRFILGALLETGLRSVHSPRPGSYFDYILVDAPRSSRSRTPQLMGSVARTVLLVARFGKNTLDKLHITQRPLESHGIPIRGCIFIDIAIQDRPLMAPLLKGVAMTARKPMYRRKICHL
jgi:hypothetical protein